MQFPFEKWTLQKCSQCCFLTQRSFQEEETIITALFDEDHAWQRRDFSLEAWDNHPAYAKQCFSFWKSIHRSKTSKKNEAHTQEYLSLLRGLNQKASPEFYPVKHLLILWLFRQKMLVKQRGKKNASLSFLHPASGEIFHLKQDILSKEDLHFAQQKMIDFFSQ